MANKRHKPKEITTKHRQVEVLRGQGMAMADADVEGKGDHGGKLIFVCGNRQRLCDDLFEPRTVHR